MRLRKLVKIQEEIEDLNFEVRKLYWQKIVNIRTQRVEALESVTSSVALSRKALILLALGIKKKHLSRDLHMTNDL